MNDQTEQQERPIIYRLRHNKSILGYEKVVGRLSFFSSDGKKWTADQISAPIKDVHVGLLDKNRNKIYCWDLLLIRAGVFDENEIQGVFVPVEGAEPSLVLLHNGEKIEQPSHFLGWNDLQVVGHAFRFPSLLVKLRQNAFGDESEEPQFSDCLMVFGWQTGVVFCCLGWGIFRFGQSGPLFPSFGLAVGSFVALARLRSRHGPVLTRKWILALAAGSGKLFGGFTFCFLLVLPLVRSDIFVVSLLSQLWIFPLLSLMAWFGSMACIMLSGEVLSTMSGGYDD